MDQIAKSAGLAAPKPLAHHDFRPDINGLRAFAVLGVVAFHANHGLLPGGFSGVDVFFVISGFLITRIILSEREAKKFSLLLFYAKRAKRILPALLLVTAFVWAAGWLWADPRQFREIGGHLEGSSYFTVNLWLLRQTAGIGGYFDIDSNSKPLLHLWSLSIEEQFYLFWPATILLLFAAGRRFIGPGVALILALSLAFGLYETARDPSAAFYLLWSRAWELALGAALAWREVFILHRAPHPAPPWADFGAGLGVALICASYLLLDETQAFPGWRALGPAVGGALVIAFPGSRIGAYVLGNRIAQFFGLISYPLYLWHWPLFAFARIRPGVTPDGLTKTGLAALAVALAYLTWRLVERPVGHVFRRRPAVVALVLVGLLAASGVIGSATRKANGYPNRFSPEVVRIFDYNANGVSSPRLAPCFLVPDRGRSPLDEERRIVGAMFEVSSLRRDRRSEKADHHDRRRFPRRAFLCRARARIWWARQCDRDDRRLLHALDREHANGSGRGRHAVVPRGQRICFPEDSRDQAGHIVRRFLFLLLRLRSRMVLSELFQRFPRQCASPPQGRGEKHRHRRADPDMVALPCRSWSGWRSTTERSRRNFPRSACSRIPPPSTRGSRRWTGVRARPMCLRPRSYAATARAAGWSGRICRRA